MKRKIELPKKILQRLYVAPSELTNVKNHESLDTQIAREEANLERTLHIHPHHNNADWKVIGNDVYKGILTQLVLQEKAGIVKKISGGDRKTEHARLYVHRGTGYIALDFFSTQSPGKKMGPNTFDGGLVFLFHHREVGLDSMEKEYGLPSGKTVKYSEFH